LPVWACWVGYGGGCRHLAFGWHHGFFVRVRPASSLSRIACVQSNLRRVKLARDVRFAL
jgi:hypothetical protein